MVTVINLGENNTDKDGEFTRSRCLNKMDKKIETTDKENIKYIIEDIKKFHDHISCYHAVGKSIHEKKQNFFYRGTVHANLKQLLK